MAPHPTSPLSREWLSMMGTINDDKRRQREQRQPLNKFYDSNLQPQIKPPPHQRRSRQRTESTPANAKSSSWWGIPAMRESPSMELEASSIDDGALLEERLRARLSRNSTKTQARVRFDQTADHAQTREMAVAKKSSIFNSPADRLLDMMSDSLCSSFELDSPSMSSLEKSIASSPILRNFIVPEDDDESQIIGSDSESEVSEPFSPRIMSNCRSRSRSFGSYYSDLPSVPAPTESRSDDDSKSKYRNILTKIAKERSERKAIAGRGQLPLATGQHPLQPPSSNWAPTTNTISRMKVLNEDKSLNTTQKAAVTTSALNPLTKMTTTFLESIGLSSSKSGSQSESPAAPLQKELDEIEAALAAAKKKDADEQENMSHSQTSKENGLPASVQVYDGRPPSGILSQTSHKGTTRQQPVKFMGSAPSIPLTTSVSCLTDDASPYGNGEGTKTCVPSAFQKRLDQLKKLKDNKLAKREAMKTESQSSGSDTFNSPAMMNSKTLQAVLGGSSKSSGPSGPKSSNSNIVKPDAKGLPQLSDLDLQRHAYVAYFTRGRERTRQSMRIYEHIVPPRFPTDGNEVVVKVDVSTISETDSCVRHGDYWGVNSTKPLDLPIIPGVALCGTVTQIDKSASRSGLKIGDQVISLVRAGANARHICIHPSHVVKIPTHLNLTEPDKIACLPEIYLSAFQVLHIDQKYGSRYSKSGLADKAILILGGTTATGRALSELAIAAGCGAVYATAKESQRYIVERSGAVPVNRDPVHWYSLLAGKMDFVICADKGNNELSELKYEHIQTLTRSGKLVVIGPPDDEGSRVVDLATVDEQSIGTQRKLYHYNVFDHWEENRKQAKRDLTHLLYLLSDLKIAPKILEKLALSKVARAHEVIEKSSLGGFVLCEPWAKDPHQRSGSGSSNSRSRK
ncbi:hypothetical protein MPSEU_000341600 [Mayamaea pseudoterrestris]|nr:hypothetical protein MPSEU_000341600 [Mayamaea pseudoterrestris]